MPFALSGGMIKLNFKSFFSMACLMLTVACDSSATYLDMDDRQSDNNTIAGEDNFFVVYDENKSLINDQITYGSVDASLEIYATENHGDIVQTQSLFFNAQNITSGIVNISVKDQPFILLIDVVDKEGAITPLNYDFSVETPVGDGYIDIAEHKTISEIALDFRAGLNYRVTPMPSNGDLEKRQYSVGIDFKEIN